MNADPLPNTAWVAVVATRHSREQVATIAEVTGQTIDFQDVTPHEFAQAQTANGVPAEAAQALEYLNTVFRKGRAAYITDDVHNLTGRAPGTFRAWCERNADALR